MAGIDVSPVTTYAAESAAILQRLHDRWNERTKVIWPNKTGKPPEPPAPYLEVFITRQEPFNADIVPNRRIRHPGLLSIAVRVPTGQGENEAEALADDVTEIFRNAHFDGITFYVPRVNPRRTQKGDTYYQTDIDVRYKRDSTHTTPAP